MKTTFDFPDEPGAWGSDRDPVILSQLAWDRLDSSVLVKVRHAHVLLNGGTRYCVNRSERPCVVGIW